MKKTFNIMILSLCLGVGSYSAVFAQSKEVKDPKKPVVSSEDKKNAQVCERCKKNTVKNIIECTRISCDEI